MTLHSEDKLLQACRREADAGQSDNASTRIEEGKDEGDIP